MNGTDIISREVGEDIEALENAKPHSKDCEFARAAKPAVKRALRISETCFRMQTINLTLFVLIFASSFRIEGISLMDVVFKMLLKAIGVPL
jgi:hypothetical protein